MGHRNSGGEPLCADAQMRSAAGRGKPTATRSEADANGRSRMVSSSSCRPRRVPEQPQPPQEILERLAADGDRLARQRFRTCRYDADRGAVRRSRFALTMRHAVRGSRQLLMVAGDDAVARPQALAQRVGGGEVPSYFAAALAEQRLDVATKRCSSFDASPS